MKFKKTLCLFLAGLTLTAATINFTISGKDSGFSKLMKNNVEAKTKSFWDVVYLLIEGLLESNSTYEYLCHDKKNCGTYDIGECVVMSGSDASKRLMMEFIDNADANGGAVSNSFDGTVKYQVSKHRTDAYCFKFTCKMEFEGDWACGTCISTTSSDPRVIPNCKPYDSCSQLQMLRVNSFKQLLSGK